MLRNITKLLTLAFLFSTNAWSQQVEMSIISNNNAVNHYPGNDGLIGNADDVMSANSTSNNGSEPNTAGSYGYNAFNFGGASNESALPTGFNAITFVNGSVTVDQSVFNNGGGPIVTALNISSGSEPFPGHGAYTSTITAVNGGTYDPATGNFTLNVDISFLINGNTSTEPGLMLSGTAVMLQASEFATGSGNAYVDNVLVPLAQASGASSLVFFDGSGMLTNLGFPIRFVIAATNGGSSFAINQGISGSWFEPATSGQGFLIDVDPTIDFIFVAWFTYNDSENVKAIGSSDQRWFSASGNYSGNGATLPLFVSSGGVFDDPQSTTTTQDGTINVSFSDCESGTIQYNITSAGLTGTIPIQRALPGTAMLCEALIPALNGDSAQ